MKYYLSPEKPQVKDRLFEHITNLHPDKKWVIEVKEGTEKRSNQQNALYWAWLTILGDHFGYSKEEMHEELSARWLGLIERKTIGGRLLIETRSTTTLTKKEFSEYMEKIEILAMRENIVLPQLDTQGMEQ